MTCGLCLRLRDMLFGRRRPCEACEHARRAVEMHERSTENLTRAALDQIDRNVEIAGESASQNDIRTLVEDMLHSLETPRSRSRDRGSC